MRRRFPVWFKLTAALVVPTTVLLLLWGSKIVDARQAARRAGNQAELALSTTGPRSLLRNLQAERNQSGVYLLDAEELVDLPYDSVEEVRPVVDRALADFRDDIERAGGSVQAAYSPAVEAMSGLADLRMTVDEFSGKRGLDNLEAAQRVFDGYSELVDGLFVAGGRVSVSVDVPELRRGAEVVNLATRQSDTIALLVRELLLAAVGGEADGVNTRAEIRAIESLLTQLRSNEDALRANAVGGYRRFIEQLFASGPIQEFPQHVETALTDGTVDIVAVLDSAAPSGVFGYDALLDASADELEQTADDLVGDANRTWFLYAVVGGVLALFAVAVTWLVSRSITRPLRSLTRQATAMANERLPGAVLDILDKPLGEDVAVPEVPPIRVTTRDEVGDVAAALNTVQRSALNLAVEQAVLRRNIADSFVNLGRRNQNLLGRQLDFITELERNETDPDTLAALFKLDHLATRMRRNAESLLVLAGVEPSRKWAAPVRVTDVIKAALSEVEDYHRVTVKSAEPATVVGAAAAGLAHLLAELIENALTFSPPRLNVEVEGHEVASGYQLAVTDFGFGMPPEEIDRANRRLAGTESFTVAPSKYLGHYVTGHLAARHGIEVRLQTAAQLGSASRGISATIDLPPALLTTAPAPALGAPVEVGTLPRPQVPAGPAAFRVGTGSTGPSTTGPVETTTPPPPATPSPPATPPSAPTPLPPTPPPDAPAPIVIGPAAPVPEPGPPPAARSEALPPGPARQVGRTPDADLLRTLANYRVETGSYQINATSYRIDRGPATPPSGLTHRVPGANLPETSPISLPRRATVPAEPDGVRGRGPERELSEDVYAFLTQFQASGQPVFGGPRQRGAAEP